MHLTLPSRAELAKLLTIQYARFSSSLRRRLRKIRVDAFHDQALFRFALQSKRPWRRQVFRTAVLLAIVLLIVAHHMTQAAARTRDCAEAEPRGWRRHSTDSNCCADAADAGGEKDVRDRLARGERSRRRAY